MAAPPAHGWAEHFSPEGQPYYYNSITGESVWERPLEFGPPPLPPYAPPSHGSYPGHPGPGNHGYGRGGGMYGGATHGFPPSHTYAHGYSGGPGPAMYHPGGPHGGFPGPRGGFGGPHAATPAIGPGAPIQKGRNASGPPGSNLFIFHIPNDMTNRDLYNLFTPYGNVISARIMVERETGRSRGFGFVSFDNPVSADAAARAMDGFQVGRKRLKVALKKERGEPGAGPHDMMYGGPADGTAPLPREGFDDAPGMLHPGGLYPGFMNGGGLHGVGMPRPGSSALASGDLSIPLTGGSPGDFTSMSAAPTFTSSPLGLSPPHLSSVSVTVAQTSNSPALVPTSLSQ